MKKSVAVETQESMVGTPKYDVEKCQSEKYCGLGKESCAVGCTGLTEEKGLLVFNEDVCKACTYDYACVSGCKHGAIVM